MKSFVEAIKGFLSNPKCVFFLGLAVVLFATTLEVLRGRATNYYDYADSTAMFWSDITPYTMEFAETRGLYFLYTPVFTTIFAPIFLMPQWVGPYVWNVFNYAMLMLAIWTLPGQLTSYRMKIILFLLSLILQSTFCFQYNMVVLYIFLLAFTLLENNKPFWAVLLIMISATTKFYGAVELALLLCYPKFWRNIGYAVLCGIGLLLLPAICTGFDRLFELYQENMENLANHHSAVDYVGILFAKGLKSLLLPNYRIVQITVLLILSILFFWRHDRWKEFRFRVQALAVLMGYIILFSDSPETHTYIISLSGYLMAFWLQPRRTWFDWTLFWLLFVNFCILPTDVLCPAWIHRYIHETFWLDVYCMTIAWLRIIWWAVGPVDYSVKLHKKEVVACLLLLCVTGVEAQDKSFTVKGVSFVMKPVKGGAFMMGAVDNKNSERDEFPVHKVSVSDFYIGETEVTQGLWEAVMGNNPSKLGGGKDWPVENISFDDCQAFIERLNKLTGQRFRLPSEEEWEYAARGGNQSKGYLYAGSNNPQEVAWMERKELDDHHHAVKTKKPNELGLYDMSGNVYEWCDSYYQTYSPTEAGFFGRWVRQRFRVIRGGCFRSSAAHLRVSNRYQFPYWRFERTIGLRLSL